MLDTESVRDGWCATGLLLEKAVSGVVQTANGRPGTYQVWRQTITQRG